MNVNFNHVYDTNAGKQSYGAAALVNLEEPIIRKGGVPFRNCYEIEEYCYREHIIDPSRSLVIPILKLLDGNVWNPHWGVCRVLSVLIADMDVDSWNPSLGDIIAFWTMFPDCVAEALSNCYAKKFGLLAKHGDVVRVLNTPFFHKDPNANERRLVEIAEDNGLRFALDRIAVIPPPETLAREIALLNHGLRDSENVEPVRARLAASIAETMSDWGLEPTVADDGGGAAPSPEQPRGTEP